MTAAATNAKIRHGPTQRKKNTLRIDSKLSGTVPAAAPGLALLALALFIAGRAHAQDLEPRAYGNAPTGLNFLVLGYVWTEGGVVTDPSVPLENAHLESPVGVAAYARSFGLWGKSAKVDVALPYASISGTADFEGAPVSREVSGPADARVRLSYNFYGAPALTLKEFPSYRQRVIVGASVQAFAPTGQYDSTKLVNIGTNRWSVKTEIGTSVAVKRWILELDTAVTFYEDNDDVLGSTREQEPIYSAQGHIIYGFKSGVWMALDSTYYTGGRTTLDGVEGDDLKENTRVGLTLALPINRRNSIKLYASSGVSTRTGGDFDVAGIAWQYRWGGGI